MFVVEVYCIKFLTQYKILEHVSASLLETCLFQNNLLRVASI